MTPQVSIIVPLYNVEAYLNECIDSIVSQTFTDWELLLIDDGSTDHSGEIAQRREMEDSRIHYYHKSNGGVSSARNFGLDMACGKYVMFVDSDDICHPTLIGRLYATAPDNDIVASLVKNSHETSLSTMRLSGLSLIYRNFDKEEILHPPFAKLYRRDIIERYRVRFNEQLRLGEDLCFNLDYMEHITNGAIVFEPLYFYRDTAGSLSKQIKADYTDIQLYLFDRKLDFVHRHQVEYDFSDTASLIVQDMFMSVCRSLASDEEKVRTIETLKKHRVMHLCGRHASLKNLCLIIAIRFIPAKLLIKIFK